MLLDEESIELIKNNSLFSDLEENELKLLFSLMHEDVFEKGKFIFHEKDKGDYLYLIKQGEVEILKEDEPTKHYRLALLEKGDCFGEMAFLAPYLRSAAARTTEMTHVIALSLRELNKLAKERLDYSKIALNLAAHVGGRLRTTNAIVVESLKKELKLSELHNEIGHMVIYVCCILAFYFFLFKAILLLGPTSIIAIYATPGLAVILGTFALTFSINTGFPRAFFGLSLKRWKENALEATLFTLPWLFLATFVKWSSIQAFDRFKDLSLFQVEGLETDYFWQAPNLPWVFFLFSLYLLLIPVQEFIARGCLQSCFQSFFLGPNRKLWAILVTNLLFGIFHGHKSFTFALTAFVLGLFWGWLYARQQTLVGPCISHALIGVWAFIVLNIESILVY